MGKRENMSEMIWKKLFLSFSVFRYPLRKERLGSEECGWNIPEDFLNASSICYMASTESDICFDMSVAEMYRCQVYIYNPIPVAQKEFSVLEDALCEGHQNILEKYNVCEEAIDSVSFSPVVLGRMDILGMDLNSRFISGFQKNDTFEGGNASVSSVYSMMQQNRHEQIDLLKLNVAGGEYDVIESLIEDHVRVKCLCVSFSEFQTPKSMLAMYRIQKSIHSLVIHGYVVVDIDSNMNFTFVRKEEYQKLVKRRNGKRMLD